MPTAVCGRCGGTFLTKNHITDGLLCKECKGEEVDFERVGKEVGRLVTEKNQAYGDSFAKSGEFLKLLYPDGIKPEQYSDMLCLVRIFDKQKRIATKKDAFGESPYRDIVGYGILGTVMDEIRKGERQ